MVKPSPKEDEIAQRNQKYAVNLQDDAQNEEAPKLTLSQRPSLFERLTNIPKKAPQIQYISIMPEGSFIGDYQILFNIPSNYDFVTLQTGQTECLTLSAKKFLKICQEFPSFHQFLCQRALQRRNFFRAEEEKLQDKIQKMMEGGLNLVETATKLQQKQKKLKQKTEDQKIMKEAREKTRMMKQKYMALEPIERPKFKAD